MVHMSSILNRFIVRSLSGPSYYHHIGKEPFRNVTVGQLIDAAADRWPNRLAFKSKHENIELTFSQVRDQANKLGASLLKLGLKPGDRIAALGGTSANWYITALAAIKAGFILAGLNPAYQKEELIYSLRKVGVRALVMDYSFRTQNYYDILSEIAPELKNNTSSRPLKSSKLPNLEYIIMNTDKELPGVYRFNDIFGMTDNVSQLYSISSKIQPDDPCNLQYTSGTTGFPKAATLSHFGIINNSYFFGKRCGFEEKHHKICLQVPLFHVFGSVMGIISGIDFGTSLIVPDGGFNKTRSLEALLNDRCTIVYGTPTMYVDLCAEIKQYLSKNQLPGEENCFSVDKVVVGGAICTEGLFQQIAKFLSCSNIFSAYGMSEISPVAFSTTREDNFEKRTTTIGFVGDHTEVKVVDEKGEMVPFGTPGEVWFRGYLVMRGYWEDETKTKEAITPCRWMKSGDLLVLSEDGYGKIVGRIKDVIIRGGENIIPSEIEQLLSTHPKILEAYVYGADDERLGEEVCASIKLNEGETLTEEEVKNFCKGKIAHFKIPKYVKIVDDFPKTASGKIKKYVLKEMVNTELKKIKEGKN